jgi:hypothetical protein
MIDLTDIFVQPLKKAKPLISLKKAIEKNEEVIMELNKQQLDRGLDSKGKSLGRYKNFNYKGRFTPIDLKLKGDYRDKFTLGVDDKGSEIFSQDWKADIMDWRYGEDITGIPDQLLPNVQDLILDDFVNDYQQQLT